VLLALALGMHGIAWLLNEEVFNNEWAGFFVEAGIFLLIAAGAGVYAYRAFKRSAPPVPHMAIEEAKEIKAAFDRGEDKERAPQLASRFRPAATAAGVHPRPAPAAPSRSAGTSSSSARSSRARSTRSATAGFRSPTCGVSSASTGRSSPSGQPWSDF